MPIAAFVINRTLIRHPAPLMRHCAAHATASGWQPEFAPDAATAVAVGASSRVNDFLGTAVATVRELFGGQITYAAVPFEHVDWTPFDIVSLDLYRSAEIAEHDKETRMPVRLTVEYELDEAGQAAYLRELLEIFDTAGVDSAFVFAFALHGYPHRPDGDPRDDLDLASYGIVKPLDGRHGDTYPGMAWEPKAAFATIASCYS